MSDSEPANKLHLTSASICESASPGADIANDHAVANGAPTDPKAAPRGESPSNTTAVLVVDVSKNTVPAPVGDVTPEGEVSSSCGAQPWQPLRPQVGVVHVVVNVTQRRSSPKRPSLLSSPPVGPHP